MKNLLTFSTLLLTLCACMPTRVAAQCTYTATASGRFSDPIWRVTGGGGCGTIPTANATVIIEQFTVTLDDIYTAGANGTITVGDNGTLIIAFGGTLNLPPSTSATAGSLVVTDLGSVMVQGGGSLLGGSLLLGNGRRSQRVTNFLVEASSTVVLEQIIVDKATITINANARLKTICNLVLLNSDIIANGIMEVRGNIDLSSEGDNRMCGKGVAAVLGCVYGGNGAVKKFFSCNDFRPDICAANKNPNCPGPINANNASQRSCDNSVSDNGTACLPLPVELLEFSAEPTNRHSVLVRWATASEKNSASFTVERSADGQTFGGISKVLGAGTTQVRSSYEVLDEQPLPNTSYYRLRQTDLDGGTSYSPVRAVKLGGTGLSRLDVYPGRSAQEWVLSTSLSDAAVAASSVVRVVDVLGRVQPATYAPDATQTGRWNLDLHLLPAGVYVVRLLTDAGSFSQRITK